MITMTQLAALTLTKTQLDQIPADERLFYFMAGQLYNDINILTKLLTAAINELELVGGKERPKRSAAPVGGRRRTSCRVEGAAPSPRARQVDTD